MTRPIGGRVGVGQLVISTSTIRPSSGAPRFEVLDERSLRRQARDAALRMRRRRSLRAGRDEDGLRHAVVEGDTTTLRPRSGPARRNVPTTVGLRRSRMRTMRPCRRPSALGGSSSTSTWSPCMAPLISLGGMKISSASRFGLRPARRIFDSGERNRSRRDAGRGGRRRDCREFPAVGRDAALGKAPVLAVELHEPAARGEARQLLEEQTALAAAAERELAHQLLVSGLLAGGGGDPGEQIRDRSYAKITAIDRGVTACAGICTEGAAQAIPDGCRRMRGTHDPGGAGRAIGPIPGRDRRSPQRRARAANALIHLGSSHWPCLGIPRVPRRTEKEETLERYVETKPDRIRRSPIPRRNRRDAAPTGIVPETPSRAGKRTPTRPPSARVCSSRARSQAPSRLYIDGKVEGSINLPGNRVTIGRNGQVGGQHHRPRGGGAGQSARQRLGHGPRGHSRGRGAERRCGCGAHQH